MDPLIVTIVFAVLNLGAVYAAAFPYGLSWSAVLGVVVGASLAVRLAGKLVFPENKRGVSPLIVQNMFYALGASVVSAILMLILLSSRFGFPLGFSIVVINGIIYAALNMLEQKFASRSFNIQG
jgi:hypothetical protein